MRGLFIAGKAIDEGHTSLLGAALLDYRSVTSVNKGKRDGPKSYSDGTSALCLELAARTQQLMKILALESPSARRTVLDLLAVSLARSEIIEEHPLVLAFYPPKLSPKPVRLAARTI